MQVQYWVIRSVSAPIVKYRTFECALHRKRGWCTNTCTCTNTNTNTNTNTKTNTTAEHKHKTQAQSQTQPQTQTEARACALRRMRHRMEVTAYGHMPMTRISTAALSSIRVCVAGSWYMTWTVIMSSRWPMQVQCWAIWSVSAPIFKYRTFGGLRVAYMYVHLTVSVDGTQTQTQAQTQTTQTQTQTQKQTQTQPQNINTKHKHNHKHNHKHKHKHAHVHCTVCVTAWGSLRVIICPWQPSGGAWATAHVNVQRQHRPVGANLSIGCSYVYP